MICLEKGENLTNSHSYVFLRNPALNFQKDSLEPSFGGLVAGFQGFFANALEQASEAMKNVDLNTDLKGLYNLNVDPESALPTVITDAGEELKELLTQ